MKNSKGITLIALVITIIVLLILAGVAISMLAGDNGILKQAAEAKTKINQASIEEQIKLAVMAARDESGKINTEVLSEELNKIDNGNRNIGELPYTVEINEIKEVIENNGEVHELVTIESLRISKKPVNKKTVIIFKEGKEQEKITIPEKFKIAKDSAEDIKDGIVVVAPDGSEFVWIPVKDVNTMYGTLANGKKAGKLYSVFSNRNDKSNWSEENGVMSWTSDINSREPALLNRCDNNSKYYKEMLGYNSKEDFSDAMQKEFDDMIEGVEKNGGFYIGRYETSLREKKGEKIAQVIKGEQAATGAINSVNTWYGLYQKEKEYSEKNGLENIVGSSMVWGSQYNQMMMWMKKNGGNVTGTIEGYNKGNNGTSVGTTGTVETDITKNVYDLHGNALEWTLAAGYGEHRIYYRRFLFE